MKNPVQEGFRMHRAVGSGGSSGITKFKNIRSVVTWESLGNRVYQSSLLQHQSKCQILQPLLLALQLWMKLAATHGHWGNLCSDFCTLTLSDLACLEVEQKRDVLHFVFLFESSKYRRTRFLLLANQLLASQPLVFKAPNAMGRMRQRVGDFLTCQWWASRCWAERNEQKTCNILLPVEAGATDDIKGRKLRWPKDFETLSECKTLSPVMKMQHPKRLEQQIKRFCKVRCSWAEHFQ